MRKASSTVRTTAASAWPGWRVDGMSVVLILVPDVMVTTRQGSVSGPGEEKYSHRKGDLGSDSRELGDHALAGGVVPAQPQQVVESAGEDPGASDQQVEGALDVAACERLLQVGAEPRLGAPGGDLAQELGGAREATRVVAGPQVVGQSLPPL